MCSFHKRLTPKLFWNCFFSKPLTILWLLITKRFWWLWVIWPNWRGSHNQNGWGKDPSQKRICHKREKKYVIELNFEPFTQSSCIQLIKILPVLPTLFEKLKLAFSKCSCNLLKGPKRSGKRYHRKLKHIKTRLNKRIVCETREAFSFINYRGLVDKKYQLNCRQSFNQAPIIKIQY